MVMASEIILPFASSIDFEVIKVGKLLLDCGKKKNSVHNMHSRAVNTTRQVKMLCWPAQRQEENAKGMGNVKCLRESRH